MIGTRPNPGLPKPAPQNNPMRTSFSVPKLHTTQYINRTIDADNEQINQLLNSRNISVRSIEKKLRRARKARRDLLNKSHGSRENSAQLQPSTSRNELQKMDSEFNFGDIDEKSSPTLDFFLAIRDGKTEKAAEILTKNGRSGINFNHSDSNQLSPIHYAVLQKNYKAASMLLHHGATVDKKTKEGFSPLFLAVLQ